MIAEDLLLTAEYATGDQLLAALYPQRVGRLPPLSTERYLQVWPRIVQELERGYTGMVAEYHNDLTIRAMLERLIGHTPPELSVKIGTLIAPWDARFRAATQPAPRPVIVLDDPDHAGFWWFRVPARLAGGEDPRYAQYQQEDWARRFPELYAPPPTTASPTPTFTE